MKSFSYTSFLLFGTLALFAPPSAAQTPASDDFASLNLWDINPSSSVLASTPSGRAPRLRLFRIAPGFLADPLGMQEEECDLPGVPHMPASNAAALPGESDGPEWIQVGMGADNPYFDLRRPGDPGGFGYYRVNTQVALLDSPTTSCTFGVQAVTPTGAQFGGLPNGATVLCPAFSVFHAVNDRLAVQGFVSKNVPISDANAAPYLQRDFQYGLAVQRPLVAEGPEGLRSLFFSVGALGQFNSNRDSFRMVSNYDMLPGLSWHLSDYWWVSSALLVPLGPVRTAPGQWQLTCSLQF
jgi:hypothetical protein